MRKLIIIQFAIVILGAIGYIQCIYKAAQCDFEPIGKAEVFYIGGCLVPPAGCIIGYFNIDDN